MKSAIKTLFLDIGGVLADNGWDQPQRMKAAEKFGLDLGELNERHNLTFDTYEEGKLSLDEYLKRVIFYTERKFTCPEFRDFLFHLAQPRQDMIDLMISLKSEHGLKVVAVSNEGRELTSHRIARFRLDRLFDFYVVSAFVHLRKPDKDIYQIALDSTQVPPKEIVYVDDRLMFVEVAQSLGINSIHHRNIEDTKAKLASFGLSTIGDLRSAHEKRI